MESHLKDINNLKIIAMHSLIGNVPPNLRFCSVDMIGTTIYWRCVFSSKASDEEMEILSCAGTEIIANFSTEQIAEELTRDDFAQPSDLPGHLVFKVDEVTNRELFRKKINGENFANLDMQLPAFFSNLDEDAFFFEIERLSLTKPIGVGTKLQVSFERTDDPTYIRNVFGLFLRYNLDMRSLLSIVTENNRSVILDKKKYWYKKLTKGSLFRTLPTTKPDPK